MAAFLFFRDWKQLFTHASGISLFDRTIYQPVLD
jgi:hypothetical protein